MCEGSETLDPESTHWYDDQRSEEGHYYNEEYAVLAGEIVSGRDSRRQLLGGTHLCDDLSTKCTLLETENGTSDLFRWSKPDCRGWERQISRLLRGDRVSVEQDLHSMVE